MMLRLALLLAVLPVSLPAQGLDTPFEQPAPLNQEDGSPFPLGPDGRPLRPAPRVVAPAPDGGPTVLPGFDGGAQVLPGLDAMPPGTAGAPPSEGEPGLPFGEIEPRFDDTPREQRQEAQVASSGGALLRGLDKVSGEVTDLNLSVGETVQLGRLAVTLEDCRYPVDDPAGDAYALLLIEAEGMTGPAFEGWMVASSPALSALDHPRYDVWVMRCRSS
jgi:hypothetical protein